jgi:hypothetical protein
MKDAACFYVVHILQHLSSCPSTRSIQDLMVNAPNMNLSVHQVRKYGKSPQQSTLQCVQANHGDSGLDTEIVQALGALRSL